MLFKDTIKLAEFADLDSKTSFSKLRPTLRLVEDLHIIPVLGKELYNALNTAYGLATNETTLSPAHQLLLERCRCVVGPMLCYYFAPKAELTLGEGGLHRTEGTTSKTAYQYQGTNYREANLREGEANGELLLEFLEENKSSYAEWTGSNAFAAYRSLFIKTGREFNELFPSHTPYRNYWAMRAKMLDVEEHAIRKAIGSTLFDTLKGKDTAADGSFTEKEETLLFKLKKAIANLTVAFSVPLLSVRIDAGGISVLNQGYASQDEQAKRSAAGDKAISALISKCQDSGEAWINDAIQFLNDNAADFSGWAVADTTAGEDVSVNTELKGSFGMY